MNTDTHDTPILDILALDNACEFRMPTVAESQQEFINALQAMRETLKGEN